MGFDCSGGANLSTYYLATVANIGADGNISPATGWYTSGQMVQVSASPAAGYVFTGFSGGLTGSASPQIGAMNGPMTNAMTISRHLTILLGSLSLLAPLQLMGADEGCPALEGKDAAAHLEYLRGDRSKLAPKCVVAAIKRLGGMPYTQQASALLIQYLDYRDLTTRQRWDAKASMVLYAYPAVDVLQSMGKPVVPDLTAVIAKAGTSDLVRRNAGWVIFFMYGASEVEGIAIFVSAAHAQTDPMDSNRLLDEARFFAGNCLITTRYECENAVLK